jgi:hypothetical protein
MAGGLEWVEEYPLGTLEPSCVRTWKECCGPVENAAIRHLYWGPEALIPGRSTVPRWEIRACCTKP